MICCFETLDNKLYTISIQWAGGVNCVDFDIYYNWSLCSVLIGQHIPNFVQLFIVAKYIVKLLVTLVCA